MTSHFRLFTATLLFWCILMYAPAISADSTVSITVYPQISFAPANLRLTVRTPQHVDNRQLCVTVSDIYDSTYYRSSCWQLDGDQAPITFTEEKVARGLLAVSPTDANNYVAIVVLMRMVEGRPRTFEARQEFRVLESIPRD